MAVEGLLNIDKPAGMTSHDVVSHVRRVANLKRVGHAGTLDPLATGVLIVALGRATRLIEYIVATSKSYTTRIRLGQSTNSYDADGEIVAESPVEVDEARVSAALQSFLGDIQQIPPMYSAIKRDGQPLYKLARQGIEVVRPARDVHIYALDVLSFEPPFLDLAIRCSKGTYIRSLAHDLGQVLGCGGHIVELRRTAVGRFTVTDGVRLEDLDPQSLASHLLPAEQAVDHFTRLQLSRAEVQMLWDGKRVPVGWGTPPEPLHRLYDESGRFAGLVEPHEGHWRAVKMFPPVQD